MTVYDSDGDAVQPAEDYSHCFIYWPADRGFSKA